MKQTYTIDIYTNDLLIDISPNIEKAIRQLLEPQTEGGLTINCEFQEGDIY